MSNDRGPGAGSRLPSGTDRQRYLSEVCGLLWPSPATVTLGGTVPGRTGTPGQRRGQEREFILLLGSSRPRLLIPAAAAPGAAAVRGYGEPGSAGARLGARALSLAMASGIGGAVLRRRIRVSAPAGADTIESFLRSTLGADVLVSLYLGPARANRKPVLQLLSPQGQPAGFAKIGTSPLTRALVQAECDALIRLGRAGLSGVTVPEMQHLGNRHAGQPGPAKPDEGIALSLDQRPGERAGADLRETGRLALRGKELHFRLPVGPGRTEVQAHQHVGAERHTEIG